MPIGFEDLLQTTAQFASGLNKGVVSTDHTFGGVRSKIDDWTDLHLSQETSNGITRRTFQDDGTTAAPGNFKPYSTIFYVADGRALVETANSSGAIRLNASGEFVSSGGQLYTHGAGTPEPGYYVYTDATATGGTGTGTDKLPKFTVTGTQGLGSTVLPAGYQKFSVVNNTSGVSLASAIDTNLLSESSGQLDLDLQNANTIFAGPTSGSDAAPTFRALNENDIADHLVTLAKLQEISGSVFLGRTNNASAGDVQELNSAQALAILGVEAGAEANVGTNLSQEVDNNSLEITSSTGTNVTLANASTTQTGVVTAVPQSFAGNKTFVNNVSISGNLTVAGNFVQANSVTVEFEDARLALGVPRDESNAIVNETSDTDTGLDFVKVTAGDSVTEFAALRYDVSDDKFKFTRHADGGNFSNTQIIAGGDNVKSLKFEKNVVNLGIDSADVADIYGTNASAVSNDTQITSLGAVAKCRITISTEASDNNNNFAPVTGAAVGYPIKHGLGTESIFVVAIKDPLGTPTPIFCRYEPKNANIAIVSVGITAEDEVYDIIVIG